MRLALAWVAWHAADAVFTQTADPTGAMQLDARATRTVTTLRSL